MRRDATLDPVSPTTISRIASVTKPLVLPPVLASVGPVGLVEEPRRAVADGAAVGTVGGAGAAVTVIVPCITAYP